MNENKKKKNMEQTNEAALQQREMEEFVWVADNIKCTEGGVMRFVIQNELKAQEALEACLYAGTKACEECDWRI